MRKSGFRLMFAACFGVLISMLSWMLQGVSVNSIFHDYTERVSDVLAFFQLPATFLAMVLTGNVHGGSTGEHIYWMLVVTEWSLAGFLLSLLWKRQTPKPSQS